MSDHSECIDRMAYLVKTNGSAVDTIISYVDTLFKFVLPSPQELYGPNDTTGFPEGMVLVPGNGIYNSVIDTNKIFLMTKYGRNPFVMPRFHIPGTNGNGVFLSRYDYLEMKSFLTLSLSSGGIAGSANDVLFITFPNGGETLLKDQEYNIQWESYGGRVKTVDLYYADASVDPDSIDINVESDWTLIEAGVTNVDSLNIYPWAPSDLEETDSLRFRIVSSDGKIRDINGWYVKISTSPNPSDSRKKYAHKNFKKLK